MTMADLSDRYPYPLQIGWLNLTDGGGTQYAFRVYPARALPAASASVFAFSRLEGTQPVPVYIGHAPAPEGPESAARRQLAAAVALGAIHALVHEPDPEDPVAADEAARRLIAHYRPPLNRSAPPVLPERSLQQAAQDRAPIAPAVLMQKPPKPF